jgi:MFS family permease
VPLSHSFFHGVSSFHPASTIFEAYLANHWSRQALVINNYGPSIYASLGFSPTKQLIFPAAWLTCGTGLEYLGVFFVDHFPRNRLISIGLMGCAICISIEAALTAKFVTSNNQPALEAAVAMFFVWFVFYGVFLECVQFAYVTEIFPNHLRAKGTCLAIAMISFMNIM